MPTTDTAARPFESLAALRQEHLRLLRLAKDPGHTQAPPAEVEAFLDRVQDAGRWLDAPADREAAQGILDYWAAGQLSAVGAGAKPKSLPRALHEFDAGPVGTVADAAEAAVAALPPEDQELARRVMLRLARLAPEGRVFEPAEAGRADLEALGDPARVRSVLAALERTGVFRVDNGPDGTVYALRYEALTRVWGRYATWLDKRARFRDQVRYWERNDRNRGALIDGPPLSDALGYHDLSGPEQDYLRQSRQRESRQKRLWQALFAVALGMFAAAAVGWILAASQYRQADDARVEAVKEGKAAGKARDAAQAAQKSEAEARKEVVKANEQLKLNNLNQAEMHENRLKRDAVVNLVGLLRAMSRDLWAGNSEVDRLLARQRWDDLMGYGNQLMGDLTTAEATVARLRAAAHLKPEDPLASTLRKLYDELGRLYKSISPKTSPAELRSQAYNALRLGQQVKAQVVRSSDPEVVAELERLRALTFNFVTLCTDRIVGHLSQGNYEAALPFIREFWALYWGEMSILEGNTVSGAMAAFGRVLANVDREVESQLKDDKKAFDAEWSNRVQGSHEFWYKVLMTSPTNPVWRSLRKVNLSPAVVAGLKAQNEALHKAIQVELKQSMADDIAKFGQKGD